MLFAKVSEVPFIEQALEDSCEDDDTDRQKALEGKDVKEMLLNVGSGGAAAAPAAGGGAAAGGAGGAEEAKEEEKPKEEGQLFPRELEVLQIAVLALDDDTLKLLKEELKKSAIIQLAIADEE